MQKSKRDIGRKNTVMKLYEPSIPRNPRKSGGAPIGVKQPPMFDTKKIKNITE